MSQNNSRKVISLYQYKSQTTPVDTRENNYSTQSDDIDWGDIVIPDNLIETYGRLLENDINEGTSENMPNLNEKEIAKLRHEIEKTNLKIENTNTIIKIVAGFFGVLFAVLIFGANAKIDSLNSNVNSKFDVIQQQLNAQKEINSLQIQRDVAQEIKNRL